MARQHRGDADPPASLEWTPSLFDALEREPLAKLSPATKLVWCFLATQGKPVKAGDKMLYKRLGLARKAVGDALVRLEALGLLEIVDPGLGSRSRVVRALEPITKGSSSAINPTAQATDTDEGRH